MSINIDILKQEAKADLKIDKSSIVSSSLNSGVTICKWLDYYREVALEITKNKAQRDKIELTLFLYYTGKASQEQLSYLEKTKPFGLKVDNKTDIDKFIKASKEYIEADYNVKSAEQNLKFIDETIQALKTQNFKITNIINYLKFTNGE